MLTYLTTSVVMVAIVKFGIFGYVVGETVVVVAALYWSGVARL